MSQIISVHSYRGGTGKSNTTTNVAVLLAMAGRRVCVVDTDIQSPGIHVLFGLQEQDVSYSLNSYLWGECDIEQAAYDVTPHLGADIPGRVFLIPSSTKTGDITRVLRERYDVGLLNDGFHELLDRLNLDALLIDTHPGVNEETLLSIAISDTLLIIMRPDHQDYQGTGVTVDLARKLEVPRTMLVVNKVPEAFDQAEIKSDVEQTYDCEVAAILPHSDEMMVLASAGVFVLHFPDHPITLTLQQAVSSLNL